MSAADEFKDEDFLAAEYALGTLDDAARRQARHRYETEPAFAAEVDRWNNSLAPLGASTPSVAPPAALWSRIAEQTRRPVQVHLAARSTVSAIWRWLAVGGMAAAFASIVALLVVMQPVERPIGPGFSSVIAAQSGEPLAVVTLATDGRSATVTPLRMPLEAGRAAELWYIPAGGAPRSMGVVDAGQTYVMTLDDALHADAHGDAFAISDEPSGGSPTGQPTGPVLGQGMVNAV
ncbi:anti-sigma factor [Aureimonas altamirensis]|uniref:anti-sigma factor n=1 Tax=Aureimonas altamirensis TaxID=370622 RepID=UPI001E4DEEE1|nr:anti-sigma factor [Aureimonas altamirensis]UHD44651.1 anti-sigma factor [Aureimonas altamirensis]